MADHFFQKYCDSTMLNPLSAKFIKWSNTLKQIVGKLPTICLSVFDHFSGLALKGLKSILIGGSSIKEVFVACTKSHFGNFNGGVNTAILFYFIFLFYFILFYFILFYFTLFY